MREKDYIKTSHLELPSISVTPGSIAHGTQMGPAAPSHGSRPPGKAIAST